MRDRCPISLVGVAGLSMLLVWGGLSAFAFGANGAMAGQRHAGFFYTITHLHPAIYCVLFLVFLASVVNLIFQGRKWSKTRTPVEFFNRFKTSRVAMHDKGYRWEPEERSQVSSRPASLAGSVAQNGAESRGAAAAGVRRLGKAGEDANAPVTPTPLDGVNHPMPEFSSSERPRVKPLGSQGPKTGESAPPAEFKFSSAVDVLTLEEMGRREKDQLMVSGIVTGPDGKGIESVIVYLADEEGSRVGQLCRSLPETGEFKVLASEPGSYVLQGYKRGFVMEDDQPRILPIPAGKIEGYVLRLIPEGCCIIGTVSHDEQPHPIPTYRLTCICRDQELRRSGQTDADGRFRISGVPHNTECFLEVSTSDGEFVTRSASFQTFHEKEIHLEVTIGAATSYPATEPSPSEDAIPGHDEDFQKTNQSSGHVPDSPSGSQ